MKTNNNNNQTKKKNNNNKRQLKQNDPQMQTWNLETARKTNSKLNATR